MIDSSRFGPNIQPGRLGETVRLFLLPFPGRRGQEKEEGQDARPDRHRLRLRRDGPLYWQLRSCECPPPLPPALCLIIAVIYLFSWTRSVSPFSPTSLEVRQRPSSGDVTNHLPAVRRLPSFSCGLNIYFPVDSWFVVASKDSNCPSPCHPNALSPWLMNMYAVGVSIRWCVTDVVRQYLEHIALNCL